MGLVYRLKCISGAVDGCGQGFQLAAGLVEVAGDSAQAILDLIDQVTALTLKQGISNSLDAKLDAASQALDDLNENNNVVEAQRGVSLTDALIAAAQEIIALLRRSIRVSKSR